MRILLAVDGSPSSDAAAEEVSRRPWPPDSEVRVVSVLSPIESILMQGVTHNPTTFDDILEQQGMEAAKRLNEIADDLARRAPGLHVTPRLLEGLPKEAIVDEAEQWGADLIVVGSNGYGAVRRFLLGSVSYKDCRLPATKRLVKEVNKSSDILRMNTDRYRISSPKSNRSSCNQKSMRMSASPRHGAS